MSGEGFLARWSRRKRAAALPEPAPDETAPDAAPEVVHGGAAPAARPAGTGLAPAPAAADPAAAEAPPPAEPAFDPASLPPVESLTAESDLAPFLRPQVPAALRQAALRRMWSLDPAIRDFIGPADYAWDYNTPGGAPGFALDLGREAARLVADIVTGPPGAGTGAAPAADGPGPMPGEGSAPALPPPGASLASLSTGDPAEDAALPLQAAAEPAPAVRLPGDGGPPSAPAALPGPPPPPAAPAAPAPGAPPALRAEAPRPETPAPVRRRHGGALPL